MGGDHKCPVCQATFTRPQHVARHMRSHTGDRPYKCQYCGDQFARSDLLSRHVNKCHANEKPLPATGTRRKGSASASRATTSKQACDQCVQSSLPCDGCNPCSKCIQRKCRCTYVKFHRQTAPAGPGHNPRPSVPTNSSSGLGPLPAATASSSSRIPMFPHPDGDFILGPPPPSSSAVSTMAETLYNSNSFAFPPLYPTDNLSGGSAGYDSKYRAQAQAELFGPGRSGLGTGLTPLYDPRTGPSSSASASGSTTSGSGGWMGWDQQSQPSEGGDDAYNHPPHRQEQQQHGRHPDSGALASSTMHDKLLGHHIQHQNPHQHYMNISMPYPLSNYGSASISAPGSVVNGSSDRGGSVGRRGSIDIDLLNDYGGGHEYDYSASGSDGDGSHSVPSSAASSSVHLPLVGMYQHQHLQHPRQGGHQVGHLDRNQQQQPQGTYSTGYSVGLKLPDRAATASTSTTSSSSSQHHSRGSSYGGAGGYPPQTQDERTEFSSAFGLMSLDDPDVIAGIAVDGQPFFSDPAHAHNQEPLEGSVGGVGMEVGNGTLLGGDMDTPMPMKRSSGLLQLQSPGLEGASTSRNANALPLPTPSRDADARVLGEFWKQYMRTPLSGPGPAAGLGDSTTSSSTLNNKVSTPFRRPRVASLPSAKTPILELELHQMYAAPGRSGHHPHQHHQRSRREEGGDEATATLGPMSSMRTTLHGNHEDLRSYEAAVMARKAPTVLNLQPKRTARGRGTNFGTRPRSVVDPASLVNAGSDSASHPSASSSLANAFGEPPTEPAQQPPPPSAPAGRMRFSVKKEEGTSLAHSRGSSGTDAADSPDSGVASADQDSARPSFKRLPSQTLGPASSKKAFYGFGDEEANSKNRELVGWGNGPVSSEPAAAGAPNLTSNAIHKGFPAMSHPDRVVASLSERRRKRGMSAPNAGLKIPPQAFRNQDPEEQPYDADAPGLAYAPAAQGLGN